MGIRICPKCGGKVSDRRSDCPHCKFDVLANWVCPDCEAVVPANIKECPECGCPFDEAGIPAGASLSLQGTQKPAAAPATPAEPQKEAEKVVVVPIVPVTPIVVAPTTVAEPEKSVEASKPETPVEAPKEPIKVEKPVQETPKAKIIALTCPNCGCTEAIDLGEDKYKCTGCDSTFVLDKGPQTVVQGDLVIQNAPEKKKGNKNGDAYDLMVKGEFDLTENQLLAAVVDILAHNDNLPPDILDIEFSSFEKTWVNITAINAHYEIDYSLSVGYDKTVEYVATERVKDQNGNYHNELVTKTRTETEWRPTSGHLSDTITATVWDDLAKEDIPGYSSDSVVHYILDRYADKVKQGDGTGPSPAGKSRCLDDGCATLYRKSVGFPGDHRKDERRNYQADVISVASILAPVYRFKGTFRGHEVSFLGTGCGKPDYCMGTGYQYLSEPGEEKNVDDQFQALRKKMLMKSLIPFAVGFLLLSTIFTFVIRLVDSLGPIGYLLFLIPLLGVLAMVYGACTFLTANKLMNTLKKLILDIRKNGKAPRYNLLMERYGSEKRMEWDPSLPVAVAIPKDIKGFKSWKAQFDQCCIYQGQEREGGDSSKGDDNPPPSGGNPSAGETSETGIPTSQPSEAAQEGALLNPEPKAAVKEKAEKKYLPSARRWLNFSAFFLVLGVISTVYVGGAHQYPAGFLAFQGYGLLNLPIVLDLLFALIFVLGEFFRFHLGGKRTGFHPVNFGLAILFLAVGTAYTCYRCIWPDYAFWWLYFTPAFLLLALIFWIVAFALVRKATQEELEWSASLDKKAEKKELFFIGLRRSPLLLGIWGFLALFYTPIAMGEDRETFLFSLASGPMILRYPGRVESDNGTYFFSIFMICLLLHAFLGLMLVFGILSSFLRFKKEAKARRILSILSSVNGICAGIFFYLPFITQAYYEIKKPIHWTSFHIDHAVIVCGTLILIFSLVRLVADFAGLIKGKVDFTVPLPGTKGRKGKNAPVIVLAVAAGLFAWTSPSFRLNGLYDIPSYGQSTSGLPAQNENTYQSGNLLIQPNENGESTVVASDSYQWLTDITIPETDSEGCPITKIDKEAFYNCSLLSSIDLPRTLVSIGDRAFAGCTSLAEINIPSSVESIGEGAFLSCASLASVNLPLGYVNGGGVLRPISNLDAIGTYAFSYCKSLTKIDIPSSVSYIDRSAFSYCTSLNQMFIPKSVDYMGSMVFSDCESLSSTRCEAASRPSEWEEDWMAACPAYVSWNASRY